MEPQGDTGTLDGLPGDFRRGRAVGFTCGMTTHVGNVLSSDVFYSNYGEKNIELGKWGVKAVEMEAAALYYLAAQHHVDALAIMTISDSLVNPDEDTTAEERQTTFTDMMKVGLETLIAD